LAKAGEQVLATARDPKTLEDLVTRYPETVVATDLDIRDTERCTAAVDLAVQRFGRIDVVVNNAGYGQFGAVEEISDTELAAQFDTNVFGPWRLTRAALPVLRAQGSGHVFFVSSVVGTMPLPGLSVYTASKFAQEGLAESLAQETAHLGIKVTILQLGGFATSYGQSMLEPTTAIDAYDIAKGEMLMMLRTMADNPQINPPSLFARVIQRLVALDDLPLRVPIGLDAEAMLSAHMTKRQNELTRALTEGLHR
jgi:NAD(P)-dependent dehydrogenase (short-subunit alcohol dehydrogenase family)